MPRENHRIMWCWCFVQIRTCDLVVHVAGWTHIYELVECCDILVQIGMWDLVEFRYTNSGVRIGNSQWLVIADDDDGIRIRILDADDNDGIQIRIYNIVLDAILWYQEKWKLICLKDMVWIVWQQTVWCELDEKPKIMRERGNGKRQESTDQGIRSVSLECIFCFPKWKFENYSERSIVTCDSRSFRT